MVSIGAWTYVSLRAHRGATQRTQWTPRRACSLGLIGQAFQLRARGPESQKCVFLLVILSIVSLYEEQVLRVVVGQAKVSDVELHSSVFLV